MSGDSYSYKFVTFFNNVEYYYFVKIEDTVYELITACLEIILDKNYSFSQYYDAKIMFADIIQPPERNIKISS